MYSFYPESPDLRHKEQFSDHEPRTQNEARFINKAYLFQGTLSSCLSEGLCVGLGPSFPSLVSVKEGGF